MLFTLLAAAFLSTALGQYPMIEDTEGFEVDMEPFSLDYSGNDNNGGANNKTARSDLEALLATKMQGVLPNLQGVILQEYPDETTKGLRVFFTAEAVFRGAPFRTNHDVFVAQTTALSTWSYANMGVPQWFRDNPQGDYNVKFQQPKEENDLQDFLHPKPSSSSSNSTPALLMALVVGCAVGLSVAWFLKNSTHSRSSKHAHKSSDLSASVVEAVFQDEGGEDTEIILFEDTTRPSHHRRWNSSINHNTKLDAVFDHQKKEDSTSSHRRSNSLGVKEACMKKSPSMAELLGQEDM